jgi:hypothetical protein
MVLGALGALIEIEPSRRANANAIRSRLAAASPAV